MPVVINKSTGLAEDVSAEQAQSGLQSGEYQLPFVDGQGNSVAVDYKEAHNALRQGMSQPGEEQLKGLMDYAKYSSPIEQAKTFAEGALSGATFGIGTGLERAMGADPDAMLARKEINPGMHAAGEVTGLVGSSIAVPGGGAAGLMTRTGEAVAAKMGIEGATLAGRAAQVTVKQAVENALFQAGSETSKMFMGDPEQSIETAIADVGMAGALGGVLGGGFHFASDPLFKAVKGPRVQSLLSGLKSKMNGEALVNEVDELATKAGVQVSPEVRAGLSADVTSRRAAQELGEASGTYAGRKYQEAVKSFKTDVDDAILDTMGKSRSDIGVSPSKAQLGVKGKQELDEVFGKAANEVTDEYNKYNAKIADVPFPKSMENNIIDDLMTKAAQEGIDVMKDSPKMAKIQKYTDSFANVRTYKNFKDLNKDILKEVWDPKDKRLYAIMRNVIDKHEDEIATVLFQENAPLMLAQFKTNQAMYRNMSNLASDLAYRIKPGSFGSPKHFMELVRDMTPERFINKLTAKEDVELLQLLQDKFPKLAETVKQAHLDSIKLPSGPEGSLNTKNVLKQLNAMSPELKAFALGAKQERLEALNKLVKAIPERMGPSGTPRSLDALFKHVPGGVGAVLGMLSGHGLASGYLVGQGARILGREAPDALKLAYLLAMGKDTVATAEGFQSAYKLAGSFLRGVKKTERAVSNVFKPGIPALEANMAPTAKSLGMLQKAVMAAEANPESLQDVSGETGELLPNHSVYLNAAAARVVSYLASVRPSTEKASPLDPPRQPSDVELAKYNRAVELAAQPLTILQRIKNGSITMDDMNAMQAMYPSMINGLRQQLLQRMVDSKELIPYETRMGLTLFLGQPLDSTLRQQNIMQNQMAVVPVPEAPKGKPSVLKASKLPNIYSTPEQLREQKRSK